MNPKRRCPFAILGFLSCISICHAQTEIAYKLTEGQVFYTKYERRATQLLTVQKSVIRNKAHTSTLSKYKVVQAAKEGVVLKWTIESVSAGAGAPKATKDFLNRMSGATFTVHLDGDYEITKFEGYDDFIAKLGKSDDNFERLAHAVLPEKLLTNSIELLFEFLPKQKVSKGDSWGFSTSEAFGSFGNLKTQQEFRFTGSLGEGKDVVQIKGTYADTKPAILEPAANSKNLPFEFKSGKLKTASSQTSIEFDVTKGMLKNRQTKRKLAAEFVVVKDKRKLNLQIEQDSSLSIQVLDKMPDDQ